MALRRFALLCASLMLVAGCASGFPGVYRPMRMPPIVQPAAADASIEKIVVCAHYAVQPYGYSKGYQVQALYTDGEQLNEATNTFKYMVYAKYVVIFWNQNQASIIRLDVPYLSYFPSTGIDQEGRRWQLSEMGNASICV